MDIATASYGADESGLICGYRFSVSSGPTPIGSAEAATWLGAMGAGQGEPMESPDGNEFIWLHFNLAHAVSQRWLTEHARLSEEFFDTLRDGVRSTRIEQAGESLVAVINDVHFDFAFEASDISTLWINVDRNVVVTARERPLSSIDRLRSAVKGGEVLGSTAELLEHLLRDQADVLVDIVRGVTQKIDQVEDDLLSGRLDHKRARLGALRRLLVRLQRLLALEPAALFRLLQHPPDWIAEADVQRLRQCTEEFSIVLRDMTTLQERTKLLQEEIAARVNEQNNRSLFVLTIVTVLALPINIITGLLGMNVGGLPLAQHPHGFWVVVAIVVSFTAVAGWLTFRNRARF